MLRKCFSSTEPGTILRRFKICNSRREPISAWVFIGRKIPSAPMARSLCGVERLPSPKLENFLPYHAVSADLLARTRRPEAARAAHCKALALEPNSAGHSAADPQV